MEGWPQVPYHAVEAARKQVMSRTEQRQHRDDPAVFTERVAELARYMEERQGILRKRQQGLPRPWTEDPILRDNRFCNVYREDDRVTIWTRENIRKPFKNHPHLWLMLAIARYINWPPTLAELMRAHAWPSDTDWQPSLMTGVLEGLAEVGKKVYTGAYMIRAESDPRQPWYTWTKHKYIAEVVIGKLWKNREEIVAKLNLFQDNLQSCWSILQAQKYTGWGPFMAYEWVTDLRHTRYLRAANDIFAWANAGPGAIRGLNRIHGRLLVTQPTPEQTCCEMQELMRELNYLESSSFTELFGPPGLDPPRFEMRDIEHTLCEFDKYQRIKLGQGKMRAKYNWREAEKL
jgi:hypothetical protein